MTNRAEDAARFRTTVAANPADRVAWHNLAAAEGDIGRAAESEQAARRAIALGIPAPETRLVLAREAFLADVAADLDTLHAFQAHPLQQSVRGGSQLHLQSAELARVDEVPQ